MDDWKKSIARKASEIKRVFGTHSGKAVLNILEDQFDGEDLRGQTVEETYYKLGQRDVVTYLRQLNRIQVDEVEDEALRGAGN